MVGTGEVSDAGYILRKEDGLSDPFNSKFLPISKFLYTIFRAKLSIASLTNRSLKRSWSHVNKGISKPKKVTTNFHNGTFLYERLVLYC